MVYSPSRFSASHFEFLGLMWLSHHHEWRFLVGFLSKGGFIVHKSFRQARSGFGLKHYLKTEIMKCASSGTINHNSKNIRAECSILQK